jgi:uncharacterized protein YndB with AHSA1/START domain
VAHVSRDLDVPPKQVWAELSDGWTYTGWVVGATHIRGVDTDWPDAGAELHHQVGAWPITISDSTQVVVSEPPDRLVLHARAWPAGAAEVVIEIEAEGAGSRVHMRERPTAGPAKWLHTPVQDAILRLRNAESLNRLASIAENRPIPVGDL